MAPPNRNQGRGNIRRRDGDRGKDRKPRDRKDRKPNYRSRLKRPGQRATIPDEVLRRLSPELYQRRTRQRELAAPFIEGSPLSLRDIIHERRAAEELEFGPQESELARGLAAEQVRTQQQLGNVGNWFAQYKQQLEQAKAAAVQPFQMGMADVQARAGASQTAANEQQQALTQQMMQGAQERGQTFSGVPAVDAAQAEASRRNLADAMTALLQSQQATTGGYFEASKGVAGGAQVNEFLREQARHGGTVADIGAQRGQLQREKGAFRTDYVTKRRGEERTNVLENKAFGLDVAKAEQEASEAKEREKDADAKLRQDQRENRRKYRLDKQKLGLQRAKERQRRREARARLEFDKRKQSENRRDRLTSGTGGARAESPSSRRAEKNRIAGVRKKSGEIRSDVETVKALLDRPNRPRGPRARRDLIGAGHRPVYVDAAAELRDPRTGYRLRPRTMKKLQQLGMRIPSEWRPRRSTRSRGAERTGGN